MKVVWYREFKRDWWCFVRNMHPILACFCSHEMHVISRCSRWYINVLLIILAIHLAAMTTETQQCGLYNVSETGCLNNVTIWMEGDARGMDNITAALHANERKAADPPSKSFCCYLYDTWFLWVYAEYGVGALDAVAALLTIAFGQVCFQTAACGCVQRCSDSARYRGEMVGQGLLAIYGLLLLLFTPYYIQYVYEEDLLGPTFGNFLISRGLSWAGALLMMSVLFSLLWCWQSYCSRRFRLGAGIGPKFYIQWDDPDVQKVATELLLCDLRPEEDPPNGSSVDGIAPLTLLRTSSSDLVASPAVPSPLQLTLQDSEVSESCKASEAPGEPGTRSPSRSLSSRVALRLSQHSDPPSVASPAPMQLSPWQQDGSGIPTPVTNERENVRLLV